MKYLPRSITGAALAIAYLLFTGYFFIGLSAGGGPHGEAGTAVLYLIFLTLPLSAVVMSVVGTVLPYLKSDTGKALGGILIIGGLIFGALVNASVIYLLIGFAGKLVKAVIESFKGKKEER
jgi:hypothetical protein